MHAFGNKVTMKIEEIMKGSHSSYIADDFALSSAFVDKEIPLLIFNVTELNFGLVIERLISLYGANKKIVAFTAENDVACKVVELPKQIYSWIYLEKEELVEHKKFDFSDLIKIMFRLRAKDGCEWDRAQTHQSIRINLIEEAYELVEAIDMNNIDMMLEESGDVLLQSVFHACIAEESGEFSVSDMLTALCRKLIDRHTHIFGDNHANTPEEALIFWNEAKKKEKKYVSSSDAISRVPKNLPSLLYSEKIQKIAKKAGFDWTDVSEVVEKVKEELYESIDADVDHKNEECGDLLFAVVNLCRFYKVEPELALRFANEKFERRFSKVEQLAKERNVDMKNSTIEQLDVLWNEVKKQERKN